MKTLFLHFYDFSMHSGVSKKILNQVEALGECGCEVSLSYVKIDERGHHKRVCEDFEIEDFGNMPWAKIVKWFRFKSLTEFILTNKFEFIYIRSFYNTTPQFVRMLRKLKKEGIVTVMEMPTYPYDVEVKNSPSSLKFLFFVNRLYRNSLKGSIDRMITFSDFKVIHGVPAINISNGIDFKSVKLKTDKSYCLDKINLIAVADIHYWHGFDRLINGIRIYYDNVENPIEVNFDIIGDGVSKEIDKLKKITESLNLGKYVHFHGSSYGNELDRYFDSADFGIASLARHRSGIDNIKTLKTREYAARGIPFIYSEQDDDFESMPYIIKAPADESPIDIKGIIDFYHTLQITPAQIRASIEQTLSWKTQMKKVITETFGKG